MAVIPLPQPPRVSGDAQADNIQLREYMWDLFNATLANVSNLDARLSAIAAVDPIPDPSTATAEQCATAINALIAAAQDQET
jgi:hypothetical protein